jgi:hypothetical protein
MTTLTIIAGTDKTAVLNVRNANGDVIDFSTATRFVATHFAKDSTNNFTVDTSVDSGAISGDSDGNLTFTYQAITGITEGSYTVRLKVYDALHTNGQDIAHECCGPYLCIKVCGSVDAVPATAAAVQLAVWTETLASAESRYDFVAFGNSTFLVGNGNLRFAKSIDDGENFTEVTVTGWFVTALNACYSDTDGKWLVVGGGGSYASSADLVTWVATATEGADDFNACGYGNGLYVMAGDNGALYTSADAVSWTSRTSSFGTSDIYEVTYGNSIWVAVGQSGKIATSPDGITWTQRTSNMGTATIYNLMFGNGTFIATSSGTLGVATSTDGTTWTNPVLSSNAVPPFPFETDNFLKAGAYISDNTSFFLGSWVDPVAAISSDDGATWGVVANPGGLGSAAYGNTWLVAAGAGSGEGIYRTQVA